MDLVRDFVYSLEQVLSDAEVVMSIGIKGYSKTLMTPGFRFRTFRLEKGEQTTYVKTFGYDRHTDL